ncbi:MAG: hypothetical protein AB7T38_00425 [Nitrospirales bacterium]
MRTPPSPHLLKFLHWIFAACVGLVFSAGLTHTQFETEPHPLDTFIKGITNFSKPTGIRGTLRYIEKDRETIWRDWERRSDDGPLFTTGWKLVPGETTLAVQPRDSEQWEKLSGLSKGLPLEMVIQDDGKGHRHILSYQDLSLLPKVPL